MSDVMKKHEFEFALENLTNLVAMDSLMKARDQFVHLLGVYYDLFDTVKQQSEQIEQLEKEVETKEEVKAGVLIESAKKSEQIEELEGQLKTKLSQWSSVCKDRDKYFYKCKQKGQRIEEYRKALDLIMHMVDKVDYTHTKAEVLKDIDTLAQQALNK